ncbi:MAG: hypothetical protein QGF94_02120 [Candidatus Thalassarchaeaceae archaeon]|nr:hypothetical protein [Candidatus Thalassarchaeaceae archaeon]
MAEDNLEWVGSAPLDPVVMKTLQRDLIIRRVLLWVPGGLILSLIILFNLGISLRSNEAITLFGIVLIIGTIIGRTAGRSRFHRIQSALVEGMDIAPLLEEEEKHITSRILGLPGGQDILDVIMRPREGGPLAKQKDKWGRVVYTTRGVDPKGPAEGGGADTIDSRMPRIDAMTPRPEFEGIEGELSEGEKLVVEADELRSQAAQKDWVASEAADTELIESGVKKMGDLVATGHFSTTPVESDFPVAPKRASPNKTPPSQLEQDEDSSQD